MAAKSINRVLQHLRALAAVQTSRGLSDDALLKRFVDAGDEAAFAALIERHGGMVLGVCRRSLGNDHDAEDACQAALLLLARKAGSIRKTTCLAGWLHQVACRVAATLKRDRARRERRQRDVDAPTPRDTSDDVSWRELRGLLDEELDRLPERYRTPLVLCYLDGKTRDEAAQALGLSVGSLHGRLERGRDLLRKRLGQRGLTLSAALFATLLGKSAAQAALPPLLVITSTRAALPFAAGEPVAESVVAAKVVTLTQGVLKSMFLSKLKLGTGVIICAAVLAALVGGSFISPGIAQDATPSVHVAAFFDGGTVEGDEAFIRRVSQDLRGHEPTPAEVHFFLASKDKGKRDKLVDLFVQERTAKKMAEVAAGRITWRESRLHVWNLADGKRIEATELAIRPDGKLIAAGDEKTVWIWFTDTPRLDALQAKFYKELFAAKDKGEVAKLTQAFLDRLSGYIRDNAKNDDVPSAMLQIVRIYESQGKDVEAAAWRDKLLKEHPKSGAAKAVK